jgi:hypothetical protein
MLNHVISTPINPAPWLRDAPNATRDDYKTVIIYKISCESSYTKIDFRRKPALAHGHPLIVGVGIRVPPEIDRCGAA